MNDIIPKPTFKNMLKARNEILSCISQINFLKNRIDDLSNINLGSSYLSSRLERERYDSEREIVDQDFWNAALKTIVSSMTENARNKFLKKIYSNPPEFNEQNLKDLADIMKKRYKKEHFE